MLDKIKESEGVDGKYRKKPIVIEAFKWTGDMWQEEDPLWIVKALKKGIIKIVNKKMLIKTLEGEIKASLGDWIIKGVNGEFYPIKNDIFLKTYDKESEGVDNERNSSYY